MSTPNDTRLVPRVYWLNDVEWLKIHAVLALSDHPDVKQVQDFLVERRDAAPADPAEAVRKPLAAAIRFGLTRSHRIDQITTISAQAVLAALGYPGGRAAPPPTTTTTP